MFCMPGSSSAQQCRREQRQLSLLSARAHLSFQILPQVPLAVLFLSGSTTCVLQCAHAAQAALLQPNSSVTSSVPDTASGLAGLKESRPWLTVLHRPWLPPWGRERLSTPLLGKAWVFSHFFHTFGMYFLSSPYACFFSNSNFPSPLCFLPASTCLSPLV